MTIIKRDILMNTSDKFMGEIRQVLSEKLISVLEEQQLTVNEIFGIRDVKILESIIIKLLEKSEINPENDIAVIFFLYDLVKLNKF